MTTVAAAPAGAGDIGCPGQHGWRAPAAAAPPLDQVRRAITEHLLGAARAGAFRVWLDARRNALVVTDDAVADYHARNPLRFAAPCPGQHGWRAPAAAAPPLDQVRRAITEHLLGAARPRRSPRACPTSCLGFYEAPLTRTGPS